MVKVDQALVSARAAYVKLRQRAQVLKVARDQGWNVARELAILQDEGEDPLLKKAMKVSTFSTEKDGWSNFESDYSNRTMKSIIFDYF